MGFLDKITNHVPELKSKAAGLAASQSDKIGTGIDKAAGLASRATKGKYDDKIDGAASKAKEAADKLAAEGDGKA